MVFGKRERQIRRILLVEDEPLVAFDNESTLADLGYDVVATVDSFDAAIELLDRAEIDLILSDLRLQGERTGIDLARAAKARGVPVLFATGHHLPDGAADLAIGVLHKPYSERTLRGALESIDRLLAGKEPRPPKGMELFPAGGAA